jgi:hypothetical protein
LCLLLEKKDRPLDDCLEYLSVDAILGNGREATANSHEAARRGDGAMGRRRNDSKMKHRFNDLSNLDVGATFVSQVLAGRCDV